MIIDRKFLNKLKRFCNDKIPFQSKLNRVCNHPGTPFGIGFHDVTGEMTYCAIYGEYVEHSKAGNTIYIYYKHLIRDGVLDHEAYVNVFIHEYIHSTQDMDEYHKIAHRDGVDNHPYEIDAQYLADQYTPIALNYIYDIR